MDNNEQMPEIMVNESYSDKYSEEKFSQKLGKWSQRMGVKTVFCANILHYTLHADTTPTYISVIITAALGYLIAPIDIVPDLIFPLGYIDDMSVLVGLFSGAHSIKQYVSPGIIRKAKDRTLKMFSKATEQELDELVIKWKLIEE